MYAEFLENFPKETEKYMINGLKLPLSASDTPLASVLYNYFVKKENVVVFSSPLNGKATSIAEITKKLQKFLIITESYYKIDLEKAGCENVIISSEYEYKDDLDFLIFYNTAVPVDGLSDKTTHISCFYDFIDLYDSSKFKNFINEKVSYFPANFLHTIICKYPNSKNVEFMFGTDDQIKHLVITKNDNSLLFHRNKFTPLIENYLLRQGCKFIETIPDGLKSSHFIFYDIDVDSFKKVLKHTDNITIIYTKNDFEKVQELVKVLESKGLKVPEFINRIKA